jgi:hypothetical protein
MANFSYTAGKSFTPFTFEQMLKPMALYTSEYNAIEEGIAELGTKADLMRMYANENPNSKVASMYNKYANDLDKQAETLAKQGLDATSRSSLLGLKRRYSSEITPIETAVTRRRQLAEEQRKARAQDDSILFDVDARTMSLDDLVNNPELSYTSASGKSIMENVSKAASVLAKEARNDPNKFNEMLGGDYYEYVKQYGFSKDAIMDAILRSKNASNILTSIVDDALASSGVGKSWAGNAYDRALDYANRGLWSAVGQTQTQLVDNWRAKMEAQANKELEVARIKAGLSGKDKTKPSNIDRTSYYFPKDRLEIPNIVDNEGKLKNSLKVKKTTGSGYYTIDDLFTNGKFSRPNMRGEKPQVIQGVTAYYDRINNILLNSGFSQETINSMNKETIEKNIADIIQNNISDTIGRNLYRYSLDENATEHVIGKVKGRGLKVQEIEGLSEKGSKYSSHLELEHEKGNSGDILFDAKSRDFVLLYQGHYYKLPKGMISNDDYNEIEGYLATDKENKSRYSRAKEVFDYLSEKANKEGLEALTENEMNAYIEARNEVTKADDLFGRIGEEFVKYKGTKNTTN